MTWIVWLLAICTMVVAADRPCNLTTQTLDENNRFYLPGPDCNQQDLTGVQTYSWGDEIPVTWVTNQTSLDLIVLQLRANPMNLQKIQLSVPKSVSSIQWKAYPVISNSSGPSFFFTMYPAGSIVPLFWSDVFNITNIPATASSVSSSATSGPTSASVSQTGTDATGTATSTLTGASAAASSANGSGNSNSSSSGKYIGIGVGVGLGVVLVAGFIGWFFFWRRRKAPTSSTPAQYTSPAQSSDRTEKSEMAANVAPGWRDNYTEQQQQQQPLMYTELAAHDGYRPGHTPRAHELDAP